MKMIGRNKRRGILLLRYVIFLFLFICLCITFLANDINTDIYQRKGVEHSSFIRKETIIALHTLEYLDKQMKQLAIIGNNSDSLEQKQNNTRNASLHGDVTRKLPNTIIIGVKKCGTRALLEYLRLHPNIKAAGPEPHFFDRYYHLGLEWYRQKMPKSSEGQLTIEKTPRYFVTQEVPERIFNMSRTIKLILVVRDPITRAISDFTQAVSKGEYNSSVSFHSRAIRRNGDVNKKWSAITIGLYAEHLKRWLQFFPMEHIHVVDGENLIQNPFQELNMVQDFLGIDRQIPPESIYMNATKGFPCISKKDKIPQLRCFRSSKGRQHSYADKETISLLRNFYKPHNYEFNQVINRKFSW